MCILNSMKTRLVSLALALGLLLIHAPAFAGAQEKIAAVVNDSVITTTDIKDRVRLYLSGRGQTPSPDQMEAMQQQVLNKLIDESLQIQEAKKLGITVRDEDLKAGFANIASQNKISPEEFKKRLESAGAPIDSLYDQIRADISWSQVVRRKLRPQINISESDIDLTLNQIEQQSGKLQRQVAEIFLNVPNPAAERDIAKQADRLVRELAGGASFAGVARQYSQAPGAAIGGDLGWVQEGQLAPELDAALAGMQPGQVSPPLRSDRGYHILFLRNVRRSTSGDEENAAAAPPAAGPVVALKQLLVPVDEKDPETVVNTKMARAAALKEEIKSCADMDVRRKDFPEGQADLGKGPQSGLPDVLRTVVEKLQVNELSEPIRNPAGWAVIMVCEREEASAAPKLSIEPNNEQSRQNIANTLGSKRLDQMATRYLNDLRASAFIDKRL
jgi:peptidyl-prolyl cis-trans isomerase SurA